MYTSFKISWFLFKDSGNSVIILSNSVTPPREVTAAAFSKIEGGTPLPPVISIAAGRFKLAKRPLRT